MRHRAEGESAEATEPVARSARVRLGLGAAVILAIGALVAAVIVSATAQQGASASITPAEHPSSVMDAPTTGPTPASAALVHVHGAVRRPGLVELANGARVVDAIAAAGGLTEEADAAGVNLARVVGDGEQLYVPRVGEAPPPSVAQSGAEAGSAGGAPGVKIPLNTATLTELETLPRVGPALAQRILDWRSANVRFGAVEDLLKVSGIGQKLFDGIKDRVTV